MLLTPSVLPKDRKRRRSQISNSSTVSENTRTGCYPPNTWDRVSKLYLTPLALEELSRRTYYFDSISPSISTESEPSPQTTPQHATLAQFARHGGPDLSDVRGDYIVPSRKLYALCLPNFFAESKGADGDSSICRRQAFYDSALGKRSITKLMEYADPAGEIYDYARTFVCTFYGTEAVLSIFCLHRSGPRNETGEIEELYVHMHRLGSFAIVGGADTFRQGATMLRNARLLAQSHRDEIIRKANEKAAKDTSESLLSTQNSASFGSNGSGSTVTDTDQLSPEYEARKKARLQERREET
ncbi:uncharacterized protein KY384_007991 [Bacidia gigantensis]|uniref:uncharacterized protein n=1 Tax=Bacidia gigantensis TaxID=2732470 RepID=UPI001D039DDB|nr:uncharacterized protein KY384_007991 [Bacidia gigantensis]KAG8527247.1 hypothetical protein KY384_007991 [Bacidia gigantensis]